MIASRMSLAEMILNLRKDLREAQKQAEKEDLRFQVEEIELEVQVTTAKEGEGKVGVNFWVYTAEAGGGIRREDAHTLRLKLKPEGDIYVSDSDRKSDD
jgi:hypothetical protein